MEKAIANVTTYNGGDLLVILNGSKGVRKLKQYIKCEKVGMLAHEYLQELAKRHVELPVDTAAMMNDTNELDDDSARISDEALSFTTLDELDGVSEFDKLDVRIIFDGQKKIVIVDGEVFDGHSVPRRSSIEPKAHDTVVYVRANGLSAGFFLLDQSSSSKKID
ncbi:hypothetical protein F441_10777 [Phytophthora nicotianae CJ01A1]|uniref:Uncharacterized protein n=3 Tax=Phytophthora nicotianae TaxID=4792 RepID=W2WUT1_PHYNI|nr:hypothetical protein L916_10479 [Phytophthora nicotianae]ETP14285.1 hypothetical protein F441_10777 [Phytophthora nicotianae CJ01A1]